MTNHVNRRTVLRLTGGAIVVGLAGCTTSATNEGTTPTSTATATASPTPRPTQDSSDSESTTTSDPTPTPTQTEGSVADQTQVTMTTDNKGSYFDPKGLLIEPGTTVQFVNKAGSHATAAYHPSHNDKPLRIPTEAEPWKSDLFTESGKTFEVSFKQPGVYDYYCPPHESLGMVGRIIVEEPQDGPGTKPPTELPPGAKEKLPAIETILNEKVVEGP